MQGAICQVHQGEITELHLKKVACGNVCETGKTLMLFLLFEDWQDLGPPSIPASVAVEKTHF